MRLGGKPLLSASDGASLGEDELATSIQWLSIAETEFRLVQRDMTLVLGLPGEKSEDPPVERTTIIQGEDRPHSEKRKIISRLCHLIVSAETVSRALCWRPFGNTYSKWAETYYRFPTVDFDIYFPNPVLPDLASDRLAADRGTAPSKLPFADKAQGKMEEVVGKRDSASRFGMRTSSFRLLLSEYLTLAGVEDSAVPADMLVASIHCLTAGCIPIWTSLQGF